jgi:glycosyltransferase involved in cell wall biosynthesis
VHLTTPPRVSYVVPSLNHGQYIREAIDSILLQDYSNVECIVIDGGSRDGTPEVLRTYGGRIRWLSEPDQGLYDAVNKGWRLASGEWLGWLNADDRLLPGAIESLVEAALGDSEIGMAYGDYYRIDSRGATLECVHAGRPDWQSLVRFGNAIFIGAALFRREAVSDVGSFDLSYSLASDYDFIVRTLKRSTAIHIREPVASFRMHHQSKSQRERWLMWYETLEISRKQSGRRYARLRARYLLDRTVHALASDERLWSTRLVPVRQAFRRLWTRR